MTLGTKPDVFMDVSSIAVFGMDPPLNRGLPVFWSSIISGLNIVNLALMGK